MLTGLDHLVILVEELEDAVAGYEELGFRVTLGGGHADGLTRNALVPFADGAYLELVTFVNPDDERDNVWGWRQFLRTGGGLVDYCAASNDLPADTQRLVEAGFGLDGPDAGGRTLPDGTQIRWKSARIRQEGRVLPFLIEDETPRRLRVPSGPSAEHPNGATGVSRLLISARNLAKSRRAFAALLGSSEATGNTSLLGRHELAILTPNGAEDPVERSLEPSGPGPFAVEIATDVVKRGELDPILTCGARIYLG
jgi:Glyoxalase-like domain